jgi:hypothetical protein
MLLIVVSSKGPINPVTEPSLKSLIHVAVCRVISNLCCLLVCTLLTVGCV